MASENAVSKPNCRLNFESRTETCTEHGPFESSHCTLGEGYGDWWSGCPECSRLKRLKEDEVRRETEKRLAQERFIAGLINSARIPQRFRNKTLDNFEAASKEERLALAIARDYAEHFEEYFTAGRCLVLCGRPGTGKTHLACTIAMSVAQSGRRALYTTVAELIRRIRSTWGNSASESEAGILKEIENLHLLILDEVGVQLGGNAELVQLAEMIDLRYRANRPTLVISNCAFSELGKYLGERGVDHLKENGGLVAIFDWASYRGRQ